MCSVHYSCLFLEKTFGLLFTENQFKEVDYLTRNSVDIDKMIEKLEELREYEDEAKALPKNFYFDVGRYHSHYIHEYIFFQIYNYNTKPYLLSFQT